MHKANALLQIVLGSQPRAEEKAFVASLGMGLTYFDGGGGTFVTEAVQAKSES
jgi:hypothetical protein